MNKTVNEIASLLGGTVIGDGDLSITGVAGIRDAGKGDLSFVVNEKYAVAAQRSSASALIVGEDLLIEGFTLIRVKDPAQAWDCILDFIRPEPVCFEPGIHPTAVVSEKASLGVDVTVMPHVTIEAHSRIGDRTVIYPGVYVGHESRIGQDCLIYPNVVIRERVQIGNRVILHGGSIIGSDGFGYDNVGGKVKKQEQFGTVVLEDDVEIGANVTIDRARFDVTRLGRGTKVDNLVQIAHNVIIGENSLIISQTGIAGSSRVGNNVILAGQVGVVGHLSIGNNVTVGAQSGVSKDVPDNAVLFGSPAINHSDKKREIASMRKLPKIFETLRVLSERVSRLEAQSKNDQESH